jgi:hypothetical protein
MQFSKDFLLFYVHRYPIMLLATAIAFYQYYYHFAKLVGLVNGCSQQELVQLVLFL